MILPRSVATVVDNLPTTEFSAIQDLLTTHTRQDLISLQIPPESKANPPKSPFLKGGLVFTSLTKCGL
jgi:hypothetical protein